MLGPNGLIGIVACNLSSEYHATVPRAAKALADQYGLRLVVFDSETKAERQISAIEDFVSKGAKAIVLCAIDPSVIVVSIGEAGKLAINQEETNLQQLGSKLQDIYSKRANKNMFVSASAKLPYGDVVHVIDIAKGAGVQDIGLLTEEIH